MMDIHTVAAGGGSICDFQSDRLLVGPESAGAAPGPACYGGGGPLSVTDINLLLGRLVPERFPLPLDRDASLERMRHVAARMSADDSPDSITVEPSEDAMNTELAKLADGFLEIAVTHMAEAVRAITTARGVDVRDHVLVGFGGAAGQHLCRIADALGMKRIIDHPRRQCSQRRGNWRRLDWGDPGQGSLSAVGRCFTTRTRFAATRASCRNLSRSRGSIRNESGRHRISNRIGVSLSRHGGNDRTSPVFPLCQSQKTFTPNTGLGSAMTGQIKESNLYV